MSPRYSDRAGLFPAEGHDAAGCPADSGKNHLPPVIGVADVIEREGNLLSGEFAAAAIGWQALAVADFFGIPG